MQKKEKEELKAKGIEPTMKNGQIEVLELEIDYMKNTVKNKETKYTSMEEEKRKLEEDLNFFRMLFKEGC